MKRDVKRATDKMTIPQLYDFNKACIKTNTEHGREINRLTKRQGEINEIIDYIAERITILARRTR